MEVVKFLAFPAAELLFLCLHFITKIVKLRKHPNLHVPPGSLGWPVVGETFSYLRAKGRNTVRFVTERMGKYDSRVFKTSFLGDPMAVLCGLAGNKFLFAMRTKMSKDGFHPRSSVVNKVGEDAKMARKLLLSFLSAEALRNFVPKMDTIAQLHINTHWQGKKNVVVYSTVQLYTYALAACLFLSEEDSIHVSKFSSMLDEFVKGLLGFPINLPGTNFVDP
ncbi:hypothetical protein Ahy_B03g063396 isoform B [Arachis hypogaea]|uniref:Beta-amyrin 28-oxidase n=1 Tax=Arachis hypogaea TaxID=3818 RepID=A0A444ZX14_ARAHY|nr:hypothetical protein Ahy_B03g063396 isoform B [Arachis hypogaea]